MTEDQRDEALFLVDNTAYLHVWATEDNRTYTADGCYTTYGYTFYDKATCHVKESGDMELFDMWDDPQQNLRSAAGNILTCRLILDGGNIEAVPLEMVAKLQNPLAAAEMSEEVNYNQIDGLINNEAPKPSVLDSLRQCQEDVEKSQGGTAPPSRSPER